MAGSMGKDGSGGKRTARPDAQPAPARSPYGPRMLGALLPAITRPAFKTRSPAATQLMTDWPSLVGPSLAARIHPKRLSGGTLFLSASGPTALELQHQAAQLIARINIGLGRQVVERLRFTQDGLPAPGAPDAPPAPIPAPVPVPGVEGALGEALARLGGRIAARGRSGGA
ncbi:DUF721 domain-containing protein [Acetobacteraceae bacterium KSS8]|uniref:DUF721 domain-containing protein n=1 Tax=Endosaccharibacter trunci TaxID=2812733 RepID=A0ABT1W6F1_9PROT|nr:DUF721 domain-containing protein [Acetobacteraceae bacterium KSS8]